MAARKRFTILLLSLLTAGCCLIGMMGWAGEGFSSQIFSVHSGRFPEISVTMKVFSRESTTLQRDNFELHEDGVRVATFTVTPTPPKQFFALVLDRSSSIAPAMDALKQAAATFVRAMPADVKMAVISFGSDVDIGQDFTDDRTALLGAIQKLRPYGGTCLYDAVFQASEQLSNVSGKNDVRTLICLTDGRDSNVRATGPMSVKSQTEAIEVAVKKGVRVITVGLGNDLDAAVLRLFADRTRGAYLHVLTPEKLQEVYQRLSDRLKLEKYVCISYGTPNPAYDGKTRGVQVSSSWMGKNDQGVGSYTAPTETKGSTKVVETKENTNSSINTSWVNGKRVFTWWRGYWYDGYNQTPEQQRQEAIKKEKWRAESLEFCRKFTADIDAAYYNEEFDKINVLKTKIDVSKWHEEITVDEAEKEKLAGQRLWAEQELKKEEAAAAAVASETVVSGSEPSTNPGPNSNEHEPEPESEPESPPSEPDPPSSESEP